MKHHIKFSFLKQEGMTGYNATVVLHVQRQSMMEIQYGSSCPPKWEAAARFGIAYAINHLKRTEGEVGFKVIVEEISGHEIDTTDIIVAYAAAHAFWDALEIKIPFPIAFLTDRKGFLFSR